MSDADVALVERFRSGDRSAYGELVARHQRRVYGVALNMLGDSGEAEEVAQETFLKAYRSLERFELRSSFGTWIHRIVVNMSIDRLRRRQKAAHRVTLETMQAVGQLTPTRLAGGIPEAPPEYVERAELRQVLRDAIGKLSPGHMAAVVLHDIHGFKYSEIAEILGCSIGTVKSRLFYARERLRKMVKDYLAMD